MVDHVDENLFSRQLGVYGLETQRSLQALDVLILGLRGVGIEAAKNLILAGPRSVTLHDPAPATVVDLGTNFYLTPECLGRPRDVACLPRLSELAPRHTRVALLGPAPLDFAPFAVVVAADPSVPRSKVEAWSAACHAAGKPFIHAAVYGAAGFMFSDFGAAHEVKDPDGAPALLAFVTDAVLSSTQQQQQQPNQPQAPAPLRTVTIRLDGVDWLGPNGQGLNLAGATFREVGGMYALNGAEKKRRVLSTDAKSRSAVVELLPGEGEGEGWGAFTGGGLLESVCLPQRVSGAPLAAAARAPTAPPLPFALSDADGDFFGRSAQLHAAFCGVEAWREAANGGALPPVRDAAATAGCVAAAVAWAAAAGEGNGLMGAEVDSAVAARVGALAAVELPPLCAVIGGLVAFEIVKATGKYTPLNGWCYLDAFAVLPPGGDPGVPSPPEGVARQPASDFASTGSRYDGPTAILGAPLQRAVMEQRVFLVGAGALGCEFLKNFALAGVGCSGSGGGGGGSGGGGGGGGVSEAGTTGVVVTDMDRIEVSNLSRQFLFRPSNVGSSKSVSAAAAAAAMNPDLSVRALEAAVGVKTEGLFDEAFWASRTLVVNALDNIPARNYVDAQCVWYGLPLLESGTTGTLCNTQVVLPNETRSYADDKDGDVAGIPECTAKFFPYLPAHCISWMRTQFEEEFVAKPREALAWAEGPAEWLARVAEAAKGSAAVELAFAEWAVSGLALAAAASPHACLAAARDLFVHHFERRILALLTIHPADKVMASGERFWDGALKRCPRVLQFDAEDEAHLGFVAHTTALLCAAYRVVLPEAWALGGGSWSAEALRAALAALPAGASESQIVEGDGEDAAAKAVRAAWEGVRLTALKRELDEKGAFAAAVPSALRTARAMRQLHSLSCL